MKKLLISLAFILVFVGTAWGEEYRLERNEITGCWRVKKMVSETVFVDGQIYRGVKRWKQIVSTAEDYCLSEDQARAMIRSHERQEAIDNAWRVVK